MATLTAVVLGVVLGVGLGWLALNGVLALAFRRARTILRRMAERRQLGRPEGAERRNRERRAH
jgi:hypothetical protein